MGQGPVPIYTHQVVGRLVIAIEIVVQGTVPNGVYIVGWVYRPAQHRLPRDQIDVVPVGGPPYKLNHPLCAEYWSEDSPPAVEKLRADMRWVGPPAHISYNCRRPPQRRNSGQRRRSAQ